MNNNTTSTNHLDDLTSVVTDTTGTTGTTAGPGSTNGRGRRLALAAGLAAAGAAAVTMIAPAGNASADTPPPLPSPIEIEHTIEIDTPFIRPTPKLPCLSWWCSRPIPKLLPDLVATIDGVPGACSTHQGRTAEPYYFFIQNRGLGAAGPHWTTIAARSGTILGVENQRFWLDDLTFEPVSNTATTTAPLAIEYVDDAWIVHDTNGTPAGSNNYLRVWMDGCTQNEIVVEANTHVGVDVLGATSPGSSYRITETTRSNNQYVANW